MTTPMMPACCDGAALIPAGEGAPPPVCKAGASHVYKCDSVVRELNTAAAAIMHARRIATVDLHSTVTGACAKGLPASTGAGSARVGGERGQG